MSLARTNIRTAALVSLVALASVPIGPTRPARAASGSTGAFLRGGYSRYAMEDVNDALAGSRTYFPTASITAGDVNAGWSVGGGFRFLTAAESFVELGVDYLSARTTGTGTYLSSTYRGTLDVSSLCPTASFATLRWRAGRFLLGFRAGGGFATTTGSIRTERGVFRGSADLGGSGPEVHAALIAARPIGRRTRLEGALGYRYARSTSGSIDGAETRNPDGSKARIDWSGPFLQMGIGIQPPRD